MCLWLVIFTFLMCQFNLYTTLLQRVKTQLNINQKQFTCCPHGQSLLFLSQTKLKVFSLESLVVIRKGITVRKHPETIAAILTRSQVGSYRRAKLGCMRQENVKKETQVLTKDRMFFVALLSREDIVSSGEEKVAPMNICHFVLVSQRM